MFRTRHFVLVFVLVLAPVLGAQVTPEVTERIVAEGRERSRVTAHLDHLVNRIGPRLTSSDNLTVACGWARDTLASFGLDARLEEWGTFPVGFNRGPWWGRMVAPEATELACNTDAWTAGTRGPARGPVARCPKNDEELEAAQGTLGGKWLLDPPRDVRGFRARLQAAMVAEGAFGFLTGGSAGDLLHTGGNHRIRFEDLPTVPSVRVRADGYRKIRSLLGEEKEVVVEFDVRNHFRRGPIPLYNVVADLPGTEFASEFVVVGGHIDSWDGATGTTDNGTGVATTIEAARILTALGVKPRRTIRFMLWSGEEQGLLGSRAWVEAHKSELADCSACLVHDGGTNYLSGISGMEAMRGALDEVFAPVMGLDPDKPFKVGTIAAFRPIGSDHESFTAAGVPGFFWSQAGKANYMHTHHTQNDTFGAAIEDYQRHSSIVIAIGALGLANLPAKLTREGMRVQRGFGPLPGPGSLPSGRVLGISVDEEAVIEDVVAGSLAAKAGLQEGDRIVKIGGLAIGAPEEIGPALRAGPARTEIVVERAGKPQAFEVTFAK